MGNLDGHELAQAFHATREQSENACKTLELEDHGLQAAAFCSPPKWHLAHTSWFFETFLLKPFATGYKVHNPVYEKLFNSYYNTIGQPFPRPQRGLLSRPTFSQVLTYRQHVNKAMSDLLADDSNRYRDTIVQRCWLGIEHEKQHQELFYTDIKYSFSKNPLYPALTSRTVSHSPGVEEMCWQDYPEGLYEIGVDQGQLEFAFDNESPMHKVFLVPFSLSNRLVTNQEYQVFVDDGGYKRPDHWLSDGWAVVQKQQWTQPLYWRGSGDEAKEFTLYGLQARQADQPVCHISAYEADAYANWAGARLPTEAEWEGAAKQQLMANGHAAFLHPGVALSPETEQPLLQLYNSCWQWTASAYRPYPGYKIAEGAIGEYNGKFMSGQWVLRGGSCVSSAGHLRPSYRNFFYPEDRWQFSGIRLAKN